MRSLNSNELIAELTHEVEGYKWDALLISASWRSNKADIWETHQGHKIMAAGKVENKHGVGKLLNKKW